MFYKEDVLSCLLLRVLRVSTNGMVEGPQRWILSAKKPSGLPERYSAAQWLKDVYPTIDHTEEFYDCTIRPGDIIYVPDNMYHLTVNIADTVFMSSFEYFSK
ncbi:hypothetical protein CYMTET_50716 [Cymbomonas tetramitiformis]|uniref:JmjC domain-containing protein n=1 Tax=Cymbomonas tetramitiformis TaxID=36881 RepID=A0AAE0BMM2_9CHLO|nr:hypothetical protein CYMTET_50716 [Cymbomonas tetramitiformis]